MINTINTNSKSDYGTSPVQSTNGTAAVTIATATEYLPDPARINAVVERLHPSKVEADERISAEAVHDGRLWAEGQATALELTRLEAAGGAVGICYPFGPSAYSSAERFLFAIHPVFRRNRKEARRFWAQSIGEWEMPNEGYVFGFTSGAMEVWDAVKTRL